MQWQRFFVEIYIKHFCIQVYSGKLLTISNDMKQLNAKLKLE